MLEPGFRGGMSQYLYVLTVLMNSFTVYLVQQCGNSMKAGCNWCRNKRLSVSDNFVLARDCGCDSCTDLEITQHDMIRQILLVSDYVAENGHCANQSPATNGQRTHKEVTEREGATNAQKSRKSNKQLSRGTRYSSWTHSVRPEVMLLHRDLLWYSCMWVMPPNAK